MVSISLPGGKVLQKQVSGHLVGYLKDEFIDWRLQVDIQRDVIHVSLKERVYALDVRYQLKD